jgi:RNA polymerase sigma factor (sigma-70 family)
MDVPAVSRRPPARAPRLPARVLRLASDDRLVEQVRAGSEPAFEVIFDRHHRGVLAFCRHMLGSAEEAEDAVQHAFMAAYRDIVGSGKPIQLRPWLYAIARNRCLSLLRARREQPAGDDVELATEHLSTEVQRREDLRDLLRDLARLPEDQRAALVLAELGAVSHEEIGAILGCAPKKVKALVFQARSSLHASRTARETSCVEIRELLASLRGGALRRTTLRRHLRECPGCRAFRAEVQSQRKALAIALPVAPTAALKSGVLGSVLGPGAAAAGAGLAGGAAASGAFAGAGGATLAAKALVVVALTGGAAAGTHALREDAPAPPARPAAAPRAAAAPVTALATASRVPAAAAPATRGDTGAEHRAARTPPEPAPPRAGRATAPGAGQGHGKARGRAQQRLGRVPGGKAKGKPAAPPATGRADRPEHPKAAGKGKAKPQAPAAAAPAEHGRQDGAPAQSNARGTPDPAAGDSTGPPAAVTPPASPNAAPAAAAHGKAGQATGSPAPTG